MNTIISPELGAWLATNGVNILWIAVVVGVLYLIFDRACEAGENIMASTDYRNSLAEQDEHAAHPGEVAVGDAADLYGRQK